MSRNPSGFFSKSMRKFQNRSILFSIIVLIAGLIMSCENKITVLPKSDLLTLPSLTARNFTTALYDSGLIQLDLSAPLLEKYDNSEPPYSEFKSGIKVLLYNGKATTQAKVTAKYAKCTNNNLWELRDSVIVINDKNERLETELLYWDQDKDKIYTDRFVKITSEDQITNGIGFESDTHLNRRRIFKVTATISISDEE
jgi:LPS export ABC transporter protein LptC